MHDVWSFKRLLWVTTCVVFQQHSLGVFLCPANTNNLPTASYKSLHCFILISSTIKSREPMSSMPYGF